MANSKGSKSDSNGQFSSSAPAMKITTVPNVVSVGNMPQGIQKTGAVNNGGAGNPSTRRRTR